MLIESDWNYLYLFTIIIIINDILYDICDTKFQLILYIIYKILRYYFNNLIENNHKIMKNINIYFQKLFFLIIPIIFFYILFKY